MSYQPAELFRSTAPYYARYRPSYPSQVFEYLKGRLELDGTQQVLDLGCGTGQLAIPLSRDVALVVAVDPEPTMLEEGRRAADDAQARNIDWRHGDSTQLDKLGIEGLHLAILGASFHWMDRSTVAVTLDRLILPGGLMVVASGGAPGSTTPSDWEATVADVRQRWLGPERRAGSGIYQHPHHRHEEVLRKSPFNDLDIIGWHWNLNLNLNQVIGLQLSYSYSAPAMFGDDLPRYINDLQTALRSVSPDECYPMKIYTELIAASRPPA